MKNRITLWIKKKNSNKSSFYKTRISVSKIHSVYNDIRHNFWQISEKKVGRHIRNTKLLTRFFVWCTHLHHSILTSWVVIHLIYFTETIFYIVERVRDLNFDFVFVYFISHFLILNFQVCCQFLFIVCVFYMMSLFQQK